MIESINSLKPAEIRFLFAPNLHKKLSITDQIQLIPLQKQITPNQVNPMQSSLNALRQLY